VPSKKARGDPATPHKYPRAPRLRRRRCFRRPTCRRHIHHPSPVAPKTAEPVDDRRLLAKLALCQLIGGNRRLRLRRGLPSKHLEGRARRPTQVSVCLATAAAATNAICHSFSQDPMTTAASGDLPPALQLGPVLDTLPPDLFQHEVLRRLGPRALTFFAQASHGCATAVSTTALMQWAIHAKSPAALERFRRFYLPLLCLEQACSHAALSGNREVLEWLHNTGCPWDTDTCAVAARGAHLEVLQWAREHSCPWDAMTSAHTARSGHLRVLQWVREHHCPWDWYTCAFAASGGHLSVLQWARQNGCPCHAHTCTYAAMSGQLEVLQWVRENDATGGAVWNEQLVRTHASGPRRQEVLTWLDQLSAP